MRERITSVQNEVRLLDINALASYISMGKTYSRKWGEEIGAKKNLGKRVLYDKVIVDKALAEL